MTKSLTKEGEILTLYFCGHCGVVCVQNNRDRECPVCHVVMNYRKMSATGFFDAGEAPHTETDE